MTKDIKGKVEEIYDELHHANCLVNKIINALEDCNANTNLTQEIGAFARKMPIFNFLAEKQEICLLVIRKVCTGEKKPEKALKFFREAQKQLHDALACFKESNFDMW
jgi:hypothetical protein